MVGQGSFDGGEGGDELVAVELVFAIAAGRVTKPIAPSPEEQAFEATQGQDGRVSHAQVEGAKIAFEGDENIITFGDHPAIQFEGGEHAGGDFALVPALLFAVAEHRDFFDAVGDLLFFEPEPDFLAVGAPGVVVPVEGDADVGFGAAKEAQTGLGIGGTVDGVGLPIREGFEIGPVEGGASHGG